MTETAVRTALEASQASWAAVSSGNREAWLALMADDVVIEDPIGPAPTNADGNGVRGKAAVAEFYDTIVGKSNTQIVCEETFPSSSPAEIAHILVLSSQFEGGFRSKVRGVSPNGLAGSTPVPKLLPGQPCPLAGRPTPGRLLSKPPAPPPCEELAM